MKNLELKTPPAIVLVIFLALIYGSSLIFPTTTVDYSIRRLFFFCFAALSVFIAFSGILSFRIANTTVNPLNPESSTKLVKGGIYRFTRNPMYLGMSIFLFGFCIYLNSPISCTMIIFFVMYMTNYQIKPEEKALQKLFGDEFLDYMKKTRRWL